MDRVPQEVPVIGGFTPCGCLVFVAAVPGSRERGTWRHWVDIKREIHDQAAAGLELRIIPKSQVSTFRKCPHDWETKPKLKYVQYHSGLIAARDGVIAAVEVMWRLRGWRGE